MGPKSLGVPDRAPHHRGMEFEVLGEQECRALLATQVVGRVGLSMGSLPVVLPVNYVFEGDHIRFRTRHGAKLSAALRHAVVCFEVDDFDRSGDLGWSVLVTGVAREVGWAGVDERLVEIRLELVTGRRKVRTGARST